MTKLNIYKVVSAYDYDIEDTDGNLIYSGLDKENAIGICNRLNAAVSVGYLLRIREEEQNKQPAYINSVVTQNPGICDEFIR